MAKISHIGLALQIMLNFGVAYRDAGYPHRITCFTCHNSTSNDNCNRVAIDRPCPEPYDTCQTIHLMTRDPHQDDRPGDTREVVKTCSTRRECGQSSGCLQEGELFVCRSCCDTSYCNEDVPRTSEDINTSFLLNSSNTIAKISSLVIVMSVISAYFTLFINL